VVVVVGVTLLVATGAGFLVPCSLENASEQVLSYAALGASLAGVFAAGAWIAPRLTVLGIPELLIVAGLTLIVAGLVVAAAFLREHERRKA
jgi:sulfite exporter TauE/SafE